MDPCSLDHILTLSLPRVHFKRKTWTFCVCDTKLRLTAQAVNKRRCLPCSQATSLGFLPISHPWPGPARYPDKVTHKQHNAGCFTVSSETRVVTSGDNTLPPSLFVVKDHGCPTLSASNSG